MLTYAQHLSVPVRMKTYDEGFVEAFKRWDHDPDLRWQEKYYLMAG